MDWARVKYKNVKRIILTNFFCWELVNLGMTEQDVHYEITKHQTKESNDCNL